MNTGPEQTSGQTTVRAFIAVGINDSIREKLADTQDKLRQANGQISWVRPQNIHCTLVFLGDIFPAAVDSAAKTLAGAVTGVEPFAIEIAKLGYFGSARSPRIIWAGIAGQTDILLGLQGKITSAVLQAGLNPDSKPFKPHLTIGRVRSNRNAAELVRVLEKNGDKSFGVVPVSQVMLMESRLAANGPAYFLLRSVALGQTEDNESNRAS